LKEKVNHKTHQVIVSVAFLCLQKLLPDALFVLVFEAQVWCCLPMDLGCWGLEELPIVDVEGIRFLLFWWLERFAEKP
jgi:hypothetical protein